MVRETVPEWKHIQKAAELLSPVVHRTPVFTSAAVNRISGGDVFFKMENVQKVGAFKYRGASHAVLQLPPEERENGIATHSSGNHAQAAALAARMQGIPAYIVMPENAPKNKAAAVRGYGAEVFMCEPTLRGREQKLEAVVRETGAHFIHPYNDGRVIAGQGTCALELLEDIADLDLILAPVGGGGLISGTSLAAAEFGCEVIGAEPAQADDAWRSFYGGTLVTEQQPDTVADGLRTLLCPMTFSIIREHVSAIVRVEEHEIIEAMRFVWERMKTVIEPSAAVPVAAVLSGRIDISGRRAGVIISGGNADLDNLPWMNAVQKSR